MLRLDCIYIAAVGSSDTLPDLHNGIIFAGVAYVFVKPDCWIGKGAERAVVLDKSRLLRSDDSSALAAEAAELQRQLDTNTLLNDADRALLAARLQKLQLRLDSSCVHAM
jgi:hypothetical protein